MSYEVIYPEGLDEYGYWEIEQKGWLDVAVNWHGQRFVLTFYSLVRVAQEMNSYINADGHFPLSRVVVVASVTRDEINQAIEKLASRDFIDVLSDA